MSTFKPKEYTPDVARIISDHDTRAKKRAECELLKPGVANAITEAYDWCTIDNDNLPEIYSGVVETYEKWRDGHASLIEQEFQRKRAIHYDYGANFNMEPDTDLRWFGIEVEYLEVLRDMGLDPLFVEIIPSGKEGPDLARLYFHDRYDDTIGIFFEENYAPDNPDVFKDIIEKQIGPRMLNLALDRMEHGMMLEEDCAQDA